MSSKRRLIRFVPLDGGIVAFDERHTLPGRGFYLCPARGCFLSVHKNKRVRGLISDRSEGERLYGEVVDMVLRSIQDMVSLDAAHRNRPERVGPGVAGAVLVSVPAAGQGVPPEVELASKEGTPVFFLPEAALGGLSVVLVDKKSPRFQALLRDVRLYESLCPGGRS